jgi:hypothetical protein
MAPTISAHREFTTLVRPLRRHLPLGRFFQTLERMDDDPVLLCGCADGAHHTCG